MSTINNYKNYDDLKRILSSSIKIQSNEKQTTLSKCLGTTIPLKEKIEFLRDFFSLAEALIKRV